MKITFKTYPDKAEYQSELVINSEKDWSETMYFTFYVPHGEQEEKLYLGRHMADVHFRRKPCEVVKVFNFHKWDSKTLKDALGLELLPVAFNTSVEELLQQSLDARESEPDGFTLKLKDAKK
jgi:hypothetical protein